MNRSRHKIWVGFTLIVVAGLSTTIWGKPTLATESLLNAVKQNDIGAINNALISGNADLNYKDLSMEGIGLLHIAAGHGHVESIRELIKLGLKVNDQNNALFLSPLHFAAAKGKLDAANELIHYGAKISSADRLGRKPWQWARYFGHKALVTRLAPLSGDESFFNTIFYWLLWRN